MVFVEVCEKTHSMCGYVHEVILEASILREAISFHSPAKGVTRNAQKTRGLNLVSFGSKEGFSDEFAFGILEVEIIKGVFGGHYGHRRKVQIVRG